MTPLPQNIIQELLTAMDAHSALARELIYKMVHETDQPEKEALQEGTYYEIVGADFVNGTDTLSGNWDFFVHGEHCHFYNIDTGQNIEVSLGENDHIENLDPHFFYNFLKSTPAFNHLVAYFEDSFNSVIRFFEEMTTQGKMVHLFGVEYRKLK